MDCKGFLEDINYQELRGFDVVSVLKPLLKQGWYISQGTGKVTMKGKTGMQDSPPWIYTNPDDNKNCAVDRAIHETCRFVPTACMDCWKIVVKMDRVVDLFKLLHWQLEYSKGHKKDRFCKCGVEERPYVSYGYGGYFYNASKTEGLKRLKVVKAAVKEINPDIEVILKRYCTEFEMDLGSTKAYKRPPAADKIEKLTYPWVDPPKTNPKQPIWIKKHIMKTWIEFAHDRGDMSYKQFNNGESLYPKLDTYGDSPEGV